MGRFTIYDHAGHFISLATKVSELPPDQVLRVVSEQWNDDGMLQLQGIEHIPPPRARPRRETAAADADLERQELMQRVLALEARVAQLERAGLHNPRMLDAGPREPPLLGLGGMFGGVAHGLPKTESGDGALGQLASAKDQWADKLASMLQSSALSVASESACSSHASSGSVSKSSEALSVCPRPASGRASSEKTPLKFSDLKLPAGRMRQHLELEQFVRDSDGLGHVFALCKDGQVHIPAKCIMNSHVREDLEVPTSKAWSVVCVKCNVCIEPKRWKQYAQWACRKAASAKRRQISEPSEDQMGWKDLEQSVQFLEHASSRNTVTTSKQRRLLARLMVVSRAMMNATVSESPEHDERDNGESLIREVASLGMGGQVVTVATLNIGALSGRIEAINQLADIIALQETVVSSKNKRSVHGEAKAYGMTFAVGVEAPLKKDKVGRWQATKGRGLGILHGPKLCWQGLRKALSRDGRNPPSRVHSGWVIGMGLAFVLHNVYAVPGQQNMGGDENNGLLEELHWRIREAPTAMQIIAGDLQSPADMIPQISPLISAGWIPASAWPQVADEPTNFPALGCCRQLDTILVAPALAPLVANFEIVPLVGLSTHHAVRLSLSVETCRSWGRRLESHGFCEENKTLKGPSEEQWHVVRELERVPYGTYSGIVHAIDSWFRQESCGTLRDLGRVEVGWKLDHRAETCRLRTPVSASGWRIHVLKKARCHTVELANLACSSENVRERSLRSSLLVNKLIRFPWEKLRLANLLVMIRRHAWRELVESLEHCISVALESRSMTLAAWRNRLKASLKSRPAQAAKWVREPWTPLCAVMSRGVPTADPQTIVKEIADAWNPILEHSEGWEGGTIVSSLPLGVEFPIPDIDPCELYRVCKGKRGSSAGADGLSPDILSLLPMAAWSEISEWLTQVERGGEWPENLRWTRVVPLLKDPEAVPPLPSATRLISVEATFVRCWASLRCNHLSHWLVSLLGDGVVGGGSRADQVPTLLWTRKSGELWLSLTMTPMVKLVLTAPIALIPWTLAFSLGLLELGGCRRLWRDPSPGGSVVMTGTLSFGTGSLSL